MGCHPLPGQAKELLMKLEENLLLLLLVSMSNEAVEGAGWVAAAGG